MEIFSSKNRRIGPRLFISITDLETNTIRSKKKKKLKFIFGNAKMRIYRAITFPETTNRYVYAISCNQTTSDRSDFRYTHVKSDEEYDPIKISKKFIRGRSEMEIFSSKKRRIGPRLFISITDLETNWVRKNPERARRARALRRRQVGRSPTWALRRSWIGPPAQSSPYILKSCLGGRPL